MIPAALRRFLTPQVLRWFVVGGLFAAFGIALLKLFAGILAWPYALSTLASGEIGTLLRFFAVDRWVFGHRRPTWTRLWQYHVANGISFLVWWSVANALKLLGVHYLLAAILAMGASVGFGLLSNFFWIWRRPAGEGRG